MKLATDCRCGQRHVEAGGESVAAVAAEVVVFRDVERLCGLVVCPCRQVLPAMGSVTAAELAARASVPAGSPGRLNDPAPTGLSFVVNGSPK